MHREVPRLLLKPSWQLLAYVTCGLVFSFLVPAIGLCRVVPLSSIVWAISLTTLVAGLALAALGWLAARRNARDRSADDLALAGLLLIAASLLWALIALQPGPVASRSLAIGPSLLVSLLAAAVGAMWLSWRNRQLAAASMSTPNASAETPTP